MSLHNDIQEILYTEEQIQDKIRESGEISRNMKIAIRSSFVSLKALICLWRI